MRVPLCQDAGPEQAQTAREPGDPTREMRAKPEARPLIDSQRHVVDADQFGIERQDGRPGRLVGGAHGEDDPVELDHAAVDRDHGRAGLRYPTKNGCSHARL
jgi:hypothetical protein